MRTEYPVPTNEAVSRVMRANRKTGSGPEVLLRSALHVTGLRFRKNLRVTTPTLRVVPDVVFTKARLAVFVDGCYWHSCPEHGTAPSSNVDYWRPKLAGNVARDHLVDTALQADGWSVVRVWEHEVVGDANAIVERLELRLSKRYRGASSRRGRQPA